MTQDEKYMKEAIRQARKAYALGEVPIGCVIVYQERIIGRGYNRRNTDKNTLAHAEITAINKASRKMGDWRLEDCTLYVTLEPCQMCAGAIVQARITEVVMGSMNPKAGCGGSILNILEMPEFNHQVQVRRGILAEECTQMLTDFFKELRIRNRQEKELRRLQQADHDPAAAAAFLKEENIVNHRQMGYNVHDSNEQ
ncbi:MAG: nucleoside deaminase [Lachnospiraceae bacterium]|nr:nucleoside deaminase [Lachnospiraceae bacterium]